MSGQSATSACAKHPCAVWRPPRAAPGCAHRSIPAACIGPSLPLANTSPSAGRTQDGQLPAERHAGTPPGTIRLLSKLLLATARCSSKHPSAQFDVHRILPHIQELRCTPCRVYQPCAARSCVMCAVWCRECHAYSSVAWSSGVRPFTGCTKARCHCSSVSRASNSVHRACSPCSTPSDHSTGPVDASASPRPGCLVVRLDRRLVLGQPQTVHA